MTNANAADIQTLQLQAAAVEGNQEALALLQILALGNRELEAGKVKSVAEVAARLRFRRGGPEGSGAD